MIRNAIVLSLYKTGRLFMHLLNAAGKVVNRLPVLYREINACRIFIRKK